MAEVQDTERPRFTVIHHGVMAQLAISANEYLILDTVYHLSAKHGYCYKSTAAMATDFGFTDRGVRKMIARLVERGLLSRSAAGLVCGKLWLDVAYVEQSSATTGTKFRKTGTKFRVAEQSTNKNYSKDIQKNISTNVLVDLDKPKSTGKSYRTIFTELVKALGFSDRVTPTQGRLRKLQLRLKTFSHDELLAAAQAIGADAFLQGENDRGKRYGDIDFLLRSDEIVDKWAHTGENDAMSEVFDLSTDYSQ